MVVPATGHRFLLALSAHDDGTSRDAGVVTTHQVTYQGPPAFAVRAATLLADSVGVELTSANQPEVLDGADQTVLLALTLEGTLDAVTAALDSVRAELPPGAGVAIDGPAAL